MGKGGIGKWKGWNASGVGQTALRSGFGLLITFLTSENSYRARWTRVRAEDAGDVFKSRARLDYTWKGVNDNTVFYPVFNDLIDWLDSNRSK